MKGGDQVQDEEDDTETGRAAPQQSSLVVGLSEKSGLVHRSVKNASFASASASTAVTDTWHDNRSSIPVATIIDHQSGSYDIIAARVRRRRQSFLDDIDLDPIKLPRSTHTLLYTEPINSLPFVISVCIEALSILCLLLALISNGITSYRDFTNKVPANVNTAVKTAQYTAIFIALLMEEDIPTGLYLMQRIPRPYFIEKFPELNYGDFVYSNMLRILMGYLFLVNVLLLLMKARDVLQIFFDFVALQFIQQLGDIAFKLARMSMLSTSMKEATTRRYFRTEFRRPTLGWKAKSFFFVAVYLFNLCGLLVGMIYVSVRQSRGDFQCKSITVKFREDIWREAIVGSNPEDKRVLVYSNFNGVYAQDGSMHDGRPVYTERRKFDGTEFDTTPPSFNPFNYTVVIPAKIQYCKIFRAWVFMHENIRRSRDDNSDCPWLLRSEETGVFDIEEVNQMNWEVWQGVIETTDVRITCNECNDNEDCNLNGECKRDGSCDCSKDIDGRTFLGPHCEVILKDNCRTIIGERYNESYSVIDIDWLGSGQVWEAYNRPIYKYNLGSGNPSFDGTDDLLLLMYSGSRWFGLHFIDGAGVNIFTEEYRESTTYAIKNYHAFWDEVYTMSTIIVSDPVPRTGFTPVGVDFFTIGERGEQFGPFGVKLPLQLHNQTGRGAYRCSSSD
mmetsp:Transcript_24187/g.41279  ORF Transcript_24187/g.41279 Transcript_24187/m.41279 type:complete len:672 (+) Transcript_24187:20-2035(+)